MSRLYDPQNPRFLSREEVARLNPAACAAACEELDQNILSTLQNIDANFVETTRIVTDVILPTAERYGRSSKQIWDSIKLWKAFFEASAGVHAGPADPIGAEDDDGEAADTTARELHDQKYEDAATLDGDTTAIVALEQATKTKHHKHKRVSTTPPTSSDEEENNETSPEHEFIVPPRKAGHGRGVEPSWADDTSPFEQLRQDIQKVKIDASYSTSSSYHAPPFAPSSIAAQNQAQQKEQNKVQQTRLRDLSVDSPDFERPALQTMSFQHPRERLTQQYNTAPLLAAQDKGKGRAAPETKPEESYMDTSNGVPDTPAGMSTLGDLSSLGGPSGGDTRPNMPRRTSSSIQNVLLQKVLMKNLVGKDGRPNLSTPAGKRLAKSMSKASQSQGKEQGLEAGFYPADLPSDWNGLADLSKAALSSFESPQKKPTTRAIDVGNSRSPFRNRNAPLGVSSTTKTGLPSSISSDSLFDNSIFRNGPGTSAAGAEGEAYQPPLFSAYQSRLSRTPAKEAARLITRDVLERASLRDGGDWEDAGMDSPPLDPPSVVKNWATRGYTTRFPAPPGSIQKSASPGASGSTADHQPSHLLIPPVEGDDSFEAEFETDVETALPPPPPQQPNFGHLADEGDDVLGTNGTGGGSGNGDDWGDSFEGRSGDEDDDNSGFDEPAQIPLNDERGPEEEGDSFSDNSRSLDDETLFGAKRGWSSGHPNQPGFGLQPHDNLDQQARQAHLFRLQAQSDMVTLHGGNLLESQPFEASPLAGRDARYGL